ncbi:MULTISPECIES: site-2 protease family protein [Streptomyces]|uniref:Site-2 protease family protein n=1 Tax=Streptomyces cacaoi TaxID=1898 RepID=A0A4Y3QZX3_STRCI|nr:MULTISPECIES: site-2 protease family protein [Streptomyces]NNG83898.1 site-2 protease family protein [Streptomyces cacaoi]QHF93764.1 site-2 protease family protein [Streptomyces sp. NHF165]GEB50133.1 site-2 protease family protein [Streptomyces cacaoi]
MTSASTHPEHHRISPVFLGLLAIMAVSGWAVWYGFADVTGVSVFFFVVSGWIVSLCLHEYAHARSALRAGDVSVGAKGYLTLNPLHYTHALLSIVLPVIFVILGGIGMPGGAVYIERGRIRGRWKHSLIAAAGPLTNVLFAVLLAAPFWLDAVDKVPVAFRCALAFLTLLQVTAALLNFLPVPGLDGFGIIEPWLPPRVRRQAEPFAPFGLLIVFGCLWIPQLNGVFWDGIDALLRAMGVTELETFLGQEYFRFWQGEPTNVFIP